MIVYNAELDIAIPNPDAEGMFQVHRFGAEICKDTDEVSWTMDGVKRELYKYIHTNYPTSRIVRARIHKILESVELEQEDILRGVDLLDN